MPQSYALTKRRPVARPGARLLGALVALASLTALGSRRLARPHDVPEPLMPSSATDAL